MTQLVFLDGTSQSMLSPRIKNPVPAHHLHSICPFESQDEHTIGLGCCKHHKYTYQGPAQKHQTSKQIL